MCPELLIDDQWILKSDWRRGTTDQKQTKSGTPRCYLPLMTNSVQKAKILIDFFQRYWWQKNPVIWLVETTLSHNWRNRFSQIYNFRRIMENIVMHYFEGKKKHQWINLFGKSQENYFGRIFGFFSKLGISRKIRFCLFLTT